MITYVKFITRMRGFFLLALILLALVLAASAAGMGWGPHPAKPVIVAQGDAYWGT